MEQPNFTPLPLTKPTATMTFGEMLHALTYADATATKLEWGTNDTFVRVAEGYLKIYVDGVYKNWIVSMGDLLGTEWVLMPQEVK